ncbi:coiled-coil domain-containing protein 9 [Columba livia]|uniref:coiled-coil domain-containing protein 9 n=1 Tax=Columba livia TaxID=8932 RepID=UPI0031BBAD69
MDRRTRDCGDTWGHMDPSQGGGTTMGTHIRTDGQPRVWRHTVPGGPHPPAAIALLRHPPPYPAAEAEMALVGGAGRSGGLSPSRSAQGAAAVPAAAMSAALDLRSKEEKDAELDKRIEALRKKNEALIRRYQEIEEDRRKAEQEGVAVTTLRRARPPPPRIRRPPRPQGRHRRVPPRGETCDKGQKATGGPQIPPGVRPLPKGGPDPPGGAVLGGGGRGRGLRGGTGAASAGPGGGRNGRGGRRTRPQVQGMGRTPAPKHREDERGDGENRRVRAEPAGRA